MAHVALRRQAVAAQVDDRIRGQLAGGVVGEQAAARGGREARQRQRVACQGRDLRGGERVLGFDFFMFMIPFGWQEGGKVAPADGVGWRRAEGEHCWRRWGWCWERGGGTAQEVFVLELTVYQELLETGRFVVGEETGDV